MSWKKRVDIQGVSAASIVDLKATVYSAQQEAKRLKAAGEKRPKVQLGAKTNELFHSNKGIQERLKRDEAAHAEEEGKHSWENIQAKLLAKSELYNRMVRGEVMTSADDERLTVDFERKQYEQHAEPDIYALPAHFGGDAPAAPPRRPPDASGGRQREQQRDEFHHDEMAREKQRQAWEADAAAEAKEAEDRRARIQLVRETEKMTSESRKQYQDLKAERQQKMQERMRQIKQKEEARKRLLSGEPKEAVHLDVEDESLRRYLEGDSDSDSDSPSVGPPRPAPVKTEPVVVGPAAPRASPAPTAAPGPVGVASSSVPARQPAPPTDATDDATISRNIDELFRQVRGSSGRIT